AFPIEAAKSTTAVNHRTGLIATTRLRTPIRERPIVRGDRYSGLRHKISTTCPATMPTATTASSSVYAVGPDADKLYASKMIDGRVIDMKSAPLAAIMRCLRAFTTD